MRYDNPVFESSKNIDGGYVNVYLAGDIYICGKLLENREAARQTSEAVMRTLIPPSRKTLYRIKVTPKVKGD